jgi:hypothetical protein
MVTTGRNTMTSNTIQQTVPAATTTRWERPFRLSETIIRYANFVAFGTATANRDHGAEESP